MCYCSQQGLFGLTSDEVTEDGEQLSYRISVR